MAKLDSQVFTRQLFKSVFIDNESINSHIQPLIRPLGLNEALFNNYNKRYIRDEKHEGFWYFVDVCWFGTNNVVTYLVLLYQSI